LAVPEPTTILVTGGAGYIGSHAAKALRRAGHRVVIYDNLSAGHREAALGAPLIEGDTRDVEAVRHALRESGATAVMHFAAWLSVPDSVRDPAGYYRNNVAGTMATLEAMAAEGRRQFVFSSTCAVYGEPVKTPIDETHPTVPVNAYGQTKLAVEHALPHFERAYGIRSVCLRYFNAAGADPEGELGEDHAPEIHVIPRAIAAACGGRRVNSPGSAVVSMTNPSGFISSGRAAWYTAASRSGFTGFVASGPTTPTISYHGVASRPVYRTRLPIGFRPPRTCSTKLVFTITDAACAPASSGRSVSLKARPFRIGRFRS
jgi:nucleoside-diphosphate-sugar epimerase